MCKKLFGLLALTVCLFSLLVRIPAAGVEFSADVEATDVLGQTTCDRLYVKEGKVRYDFLKDGKVSRSTIWLPEKKILWTLFSEKQYDEDPAPMDPYQIPAGEYDQVALGGEKVNGYECEVTQYKYQKKSLGSWTRWYSPRLNYGIKVVKKTANGKIQRIFELKNIVEEPLEEALFTIPPGAKKVPLYGDIPVSYFTAKSEKTEYTYLYLLPDNYKAVKEKKKWPLILYLHGMGGRGLDIDMIRKDISVRLILKHTRGKCIIAAPQCPMDTERWSVEGLDLLLNEIIAKFAVDHDRIYLTGISMGGSGTWYFGAAHPEYFAAVVPLCGWGDESQAPLLANVPVWVFHSTLDGAVPFVESEKMVNALKEKGGNVRFTIYEGNVHDISEMTYDNPELYEWLLKQKRG